MASFGESRSTLTKLVGPSAKTVRPGRDETELLQSLTKAFSVLRRTGDRESALRESFLHAIAGVRAEKAALLSILGQDPLELQVVCSEGLGRDEEAACRLLRSTPGVSPTLVRRAIEAGEPVLLENSHLPGGVTTTSSLLGRPYSVLCAPLLDVMTSAPMALLYFQNDVRFAFGNEDLEWVGAYTAALAQAFALHAASQERIRELESDQGRLQGAGQYEMVGESEATRKLFATLDTYLPSTGRPDAPPILVLGDSGTGKELVARYLHDHSRKRSRGPFQAFNCAGLRGDLIESRLFGHSRGSFTGAVADVRGLFRTADRGVLFLDEVGDLPADGQALLLRTLETRSVQPLGETREIAVDVQLVLATNRDLAQEVAAGRFRPDLYYRINGLAVHLLPLSHPSRVADIRPLLSHYLAKHERLLKKKTLGLTPGAYRVLVQYSWPGNIREVNNVCLTLVTTAAPGAWIDVANIEEHRPELLRGPKNPNPEAYIDDESSTYAEAVEVFRNKLILDRLRRHGGSAVEAAKSLRVSEPTFYRYWAEARRLAEEDP